MRTIARMRALGRRLIAGNGRQLDSAATLAGALVIRLNAARWTIARVTKLRALMSLPAAKLLVAEVVAGVHICGARAAEILALMSAAGHLGATLLGTSKLLGHRPAHDAAAGTAASAGDLCAGLAGRAISVVTRIGASVHAAIEQLIARGLAKRNGIKARVARAIGHGLPSTRTVVDHLWS